MDEWYYQRGETTFGPISGVTLHSLIKRGRLQNDTLVRKSGEEGWSTAAQVLPHLPPVLDSPPATDSPQPSDQPTTTPTFDSSLPGASVIYAPPQSTQADQPQPQLPVYLWMGAILCAGGLLFEIACWISLVFVHLSGHTSSWPDWLKQFAQVLTSFFNEKTTSIATKFTAVALILWQACAFASLRNLYGGLVRRNLACGLWWFVPIANLFKPLLCLRDMRYLSRTRRDVPDPRASFGPLLITMEALIVIPIFSILLTALSPDSSDHVGHSTAMQIVEDSGTIAFTTTLLIIVIANFLQQKRLYAHWTDDAYWQDRWSY